MTQVKLFAFGRRREGMSLADFHDHWRHPHGTWGRRMTILQGYVQSHPMPTPYLGASQSRYDCVAEMWLERECLTGFAEDPVFADYLVPDSPNFCDPSSTLSLAAEEEVLPASACAGPADALWSPQACPVSVKLLQFVSRATPHWAGADDPAHADAIGALRHVRCRALTESLTANCPYIGVRELWWPTLRAFERGVGAAPQALKELLSPDERSTALLVQAERYF